MSLPTDLLFSSNASIVFIAIHLSRIFSKKIKNKKKALCGIRPFNPSSVAIRGGGEDEGMEGGAEEDRNENKPEWRR